jgi:predicted TIM-barrel fold metal-dependent hydrolase
MTNLALAPMLIDAHTHVVPAALETMAEIMAANNLTAVVNLGVLESEGIPFEEGMRAFREVLGDRMVYFPAPDLSDVAPGFGQRMADELERKVEAGAAGLKIFKTLGLHCRDADGRLIPVDDSRLNPLWARAGELGVPVLIHSSDVLAHFQPLDEDNEQWEALTRFPDWHVYGDQFPGHDELLEQRNRVIARHPDTTFIGAHVGMYYEKLDIVDAWLDRFPNLNVDTAASIVQLGRHPAERVRAFFVKHQDRILFGTDLVLGSYEEDDQGGRPWAFKRVGYDYGLPRRFYETDDRQLEHPGYPVFGNWLVDGIGLPGDVLEKLYAGNARRLIPALTGQGR